MSRLARQAIPATNALAGMVLRDRPQARAAEVVFVALFCDNFNVRYGLKDGQAREKSGQNLAFAANVEPPPLLDTIFMLYSGCRGRL